MSEILSIEQLKKMATTTIEIPDFEGTGTIKVRVQKPRLMAMAAQGKIPNHLLGVVNQMMFEKNSKKEKKTDIIDIIKIYELYCRACLVEPSYDEFKDFITDDQMQAIFDWATRDAKNLENFRTNQRNGTSNNNSQQIQEKTK